MRLYPDIESFLIHKVPSRRLPVWGELTCLEIEPALVYQKLFKACLESFLFESGSGPETTCRYSFFGQSNASSLRLEDQGVWVKSNGNLQSAPISKEKCFDLLEFEGDLESENHPGHFWGGWVDIWVMS